MRKIFKMTLLFSTVLAFGLTSCENTDEVVPSVGQKMEFIYAPVPSANTIDYMWYKVVGASSYTIEVSTASSFATLVVQETVTGTSYKATDLYYDLPYYSRIRANYDGAASGDWVVSGPTTCSRLVLPVLKQVIPSDINAKNGIDVTFSWLEQEGLDRIQVLDSATNELYITHILTDTEKEERKATLRVPYKDIRVKAALYLSEDYPDATLAGLPMNFRSFIPFYPKAITSVLLSGGVRNPKLGWNTNMNVTRIEILDASGAVVNVGGVDLIKDLSDAETALGTYTFAGIILPEGNFSAIAFNMEDADPAAQEFAKYAFTAKVPDPLTKSSDLITAVTNADPGGLIKLAEVVDGTVGAMTITKGLDITGVPTALARLPKLRPTATWTLSGAHTSPLTFSNINFLPQVGTTQLAVPFITVAAGFTSPKVMFKNCRISKANYDVMQFANGATIIDSVIFEDCIIDWDFGPDVVSTSVGGSGFLNLNAGPTVIKNLLLKNCTIVGLPFALAKIQSNTTTVNYTYEFVNNTFYDLNRVKDELFRPGGSAVKTLKMKNNIFAARYMAADPNFDPALPGGRSANYRLCIGENAFLPVLDERSALPHNTYATFDYLLGGTVTRIESSKYQTNNSYALIKNMKPLGADVDNPKGLVSTAIFVDPATLDFHFKSAAIGALGIGDKRWWPAGTVPMP